MRIFVYAGNKMIKDAALYTYAITMSSILAAKENVTLVHDGSTTGVSGKLLKEYLKHKKHVEFLIPKSHYGFEFVILKNHIGEENFTIKHCSTDEDWLNEVFMCDAIVLLPCEEKDAKQMLSHLANVKQANKPKLVIANINNYFYNFLKEIEKDVQRGTIPANTLNEITILNTKPVCKNEKELNNFSNNLK